MDKGADKLKGSLKKMCLALPGKLVEINGNTGQVDFGGTKRSVKLDLVNAGIGDYVIVHVGYAIEVLNEKEALESLKLWDEFLSQTEDA